MGSIADRLREVRARLDSATRAAGRDPGSVMLLPVTKGVGVEAIREAYDAGAAAFGENYVQEAEEKMSALPPEISWHFIGHLQRRKVRSVVGTFSVIHSLDSLDLAREISRRAAGRGITQSVLLEVNIGGEATKSGCAPSGAAALAAEISRLPGLSLAGLMCIPPRLDDPEESRPLFRAMRALRSAVAKECGKAEDTLDLSMGMSGDFEAAIGEGATIVRVGTAIFGPRQEHT